MAQGRGNFDKFIMIYLSVGCFAILPRFLYKRLSSVAPQPSFRFILFLVCGSLLLSGQPWSRMKSTLLYDFFSATSAAIIKRSLRDTRDCTATLGFNPLGSMNYNPAEDPYYISNLDSPVDEFFVNALEGTKFTNIVHIVLESMRADSYPFQEESLLVDFMKENYQSIPDGAAITTSNVSPFIESLAEHTISWETVFATISFTHKAMIGRKCTVRLVLMVDYCGQLGLPLDFSVEFEPPAEMYQHCLPQVFRHINSVTDTEDEIRAIASGNRSEITDIWETVHIEAARGEYDHEKDILQGVGFGAVLAGEDIEEIRNENFTNAHGWDDETALEFLWKYVDNTIARNPRPRMYLGWMSTTTHTPFDISSDWLEENYQPFNNDYRKWASSDRYLNAVRWTDDKVKELILGFRERGLEDETLFLMSSIFRPC